MSPVVVLKFGGELLEREVKLRDLARTIATVVQDGVSLVIVHGGGKEIDAALGAAGIEKRQVDGLRITDEATLEIVVRVLAGAVNTRFVASLTTAGVPAVGLTGADAGCGRADLAPPHRAVDERVVDLGRVGVPTEAADVRLLRVLVASGFVPVVASIGLDEDGGLLNINADTFAGHIAARLSATRLVIAGTTPGVLDAEGQTLRTLDREQMDALIQHRTATAGMIAKLRACERALSAGVAEVTMLDGRDADAIQAAVLGRPVANATVLTEIGEARPAELDRAGSR